MRKTHGKNITDRKEKETDTFVRGMDHNFSSRNLAQQKISVSALAYFAGYSHIDLPAH